MSKVTDLVVGDVIIVEAGMRVPADCVLVEGMDIVCDESMYPELKESVEKRISLGVDHHRENPDPFLLSRSLVKSGSGKAVVCAVGQQTRWTIENPVEDLEDDNNLTPLQTKLNTLANYIKKWSILSGVLIFIFLNVFLASKIIFSDDQLLSNETL